MSRGSGTEGCDWRGRGPSPVTQVRGAAATCPATRCECHDSLVYGQAAACPAREIPPITGMTAGCDLAPQEEAGCPRTTTSGASSRRSTKGSVEQVPKPVRHSARAGGRRLTSIAFQWPLRGHRRLGNLRYRRRPSVSTRPPLVRPHFD